MYQQTVVIRNKAGIHCRPSSVIMFAAEPYAASHEILITGPRGVSIWVREKAFEDIIINE